MILPIIQLKISANHPKIGPNHNINDIINGPYPENVRKEDKYDEHIILLLEDMLS